MSIPLVQGALASIVPPADAAGDVPAPLPENVRHMLFGTLSAVQTTIKDLHRLNYAEPNDWSRPISTGRANEVMAILTKRMQGE